MEKTTGGSLEAVLGQVRAQAQTGNAAAQPNQGELRHVPLEALEDNPFQPRKAMDDTELEELASSIERDGLLQPIAIRPKSDGRYFIVAGHRRRAAYQRLCERATSDDARKRWSTIPGFVQLALDDTKMAVDAYVENSRRSALNAIEEAEALARIKELASVKTAKDVAQLTSQPEQRVARLMRLANAPAVIREGVATGVMVPILKEDGTVDTTATGKPKREHRRLDLLAALEFARMHKHLLDKRGPKYADERVRSAIADSLSENWGLRRITSYVDGVISGRAKAQASAPREEGADHALEAGLERESRSIRHRPPAARQCERGRPRCAEAGAGCGPWRRPGRTPPETALRALTRPQSALIKPVGSPVGCGTGDPIGEPT